MDKREKFTSKLGFVMACIGSAIGLGNIWMFPYRLGAYGGAAFLIPYFIFVFILGTTGLITEFAFGRHFSGGSMTGIMTVFKEKKLKGGKFVGMLPAIGLLGIFMFYNIVVGWILKYFVLSGTGKLKTIDKDTYFNQFAGSSASIPWDAIAIVLTVVVICAGVIKGIERVSKIIMPALFVIFILLAIRSLSLPGSMEGVKFLLQPKWHHLLEVDTWVMALGQAFFTVSLNGCGMVVYGSYLKKDEDVIACARNVAIFDTLAALLSAFVILPAVFAFQLDPSAGPALMFITMPKVFQQMPVGTFFCILFFVAVLFAAVTSLINLFETPVEAIQERFGVSRKIAVAIVAVVAVAVGVVIESGDVVSTWMDVVSIYIIPLGALLAAIMFFWVCPPRFAREQVQMGREKKIGKWFEPMTKYIFVGLTIVVYILGILYGGIG